MLLSRGVFVRDLEAAISNLQFGRPSNFTDLVADTVSVSRLTPVQKEQFATSLLEGGDKPDLLTPFLVGLDGDALSRLRNQAMRKNHVHSAFALGVDSKDINFKRLLIQNGDQALVQAVLRKSPNFVLNFNAQDWDCLMTNPCSSNELSPAATKLWESVENRKPTELPLAQRFAVRYAKVPIALRYINDLQRPQDSTIAASLVRVAMFRNETTLINALLDKLGPRLSDEVLMSVVDGAAAKGSVEPVKKVKQQMIESQKRNELLERAMHYPASAAFVSWMFDNFNIETRHVISLIARCIGSGDPYRASAEAAWDALEQKTEGVVQANEVALMKELIAASRRFSASVENLRNKGFQIPLSWEGKSVIDHFADLKWAKDYDLVTLLIELRREVAETPVVAGVPNPRLEAVRQVLAQYEDQPVAEK